MDQELKTYSCEKPTAIFANIAIVYITACLIYLVITRSIGTPFNDSLNDEQREIKKQSAKKRGSIFFFSILISIVILFIWKPFKCSSGQFNLF
jgi:hypothetical protein